MDQYTVDFAREDWPQRLPQVYRQHGVAIITNVFPAEYCDSAMDTIVTYMETMGSGVKRDDPETWTPYLVGPQVRTGLFQVLYSHIPAVWNIRSHSGVKKIFQVLYSDLRGKPVTDFLVSNDGINVKHPNCGPYALQAKDWPHLDQTYRDDIFKCVQGQAVLTNTTAAFVCSPRSHLCHTAILEACEVSPHEKKQWLPFCDETAKVVKKIVTEAGGDWQQPMMAPRGSFIVWSSTTVHSAKYQDAPQLAKDPADPWKGWRGVVYVCYRPKDEFTQRQQRSMDRFYRGNRVSNHWGTTVFPKRPGEHYGRRCYHPYIDRVLDAPEQLYELPGHAKPELTAEQKALIGIAPK